MKRRSVTGARGRAIRSRTGSARISDVDAAEMTPHPPTLPTPPPLVLPRGRSSFGHDEPLPANVFTQRVLRMVYLLSRRPDACSLLASPDSPDATRLSGYDEIRWIHATSELAARLKDDASLSDGQRQALREAIAESPKGWELNWDAKRFADQLRRCEGRRFLLLPVRLVQGRHRHANLLLVDTVSREITHIEPNGSVVLQPGNLGDTFHLPELYGRIAGVARALGFTYVAPHAEGCPIAGFQYREAFQKHRPRDFRGLCGAWATWMADLRLRFPEAPWSALQRAALLLLEREPGLLMDFVQDYDRHVLATARNQVLRGGGGAEPEFESESTAQRERRIDILLRKALQRQHGLLFARD